MPTHDLLQRTVPPCPPAPTAICRRSLDALGDHRAACATAAVLASRADPSKRALAKVCGETGASRQECAAGRNELGCAGAKCSAHRGCSQRPPTLARGAVSGSLVSPSRRDGQPRADSHVHPGVIMSQAASRKRRQTYSELGRQPAAWPWDLGPKRLQSRWTTEICWLGRKKTRKMASKFVPMNVCPATN